MRVLPSGRDAPFACRRRIILDLEESLADHAAFDPFVPHRPHQNLDRRTFRDYVVS